MPAINTTELTTEALDGTGVFDELMNSTLVHIQSQFDKGAITGSDFATVYLGAVQSVLQQSVAFLLQKNKAGLEADLLIEQILIAKQKVIESVKQNALLDQQILIATAQVAKTQQETTNLVAGKLKIDADTALAVQQRLNAITQNTTLVRQQDKLLAEVNLLAQRLVTETAQTETGTVTGIVGAQRALYVKQTDGFDRDAEQKAAQIYKDVWVVSRTTDNGTVADASNGLSAADTLAVMNKLKAGINT